MARKILIRGLNFVLLLVLVSLALSRTSHAATAENNSSDKIQINNISSTVQDNSAVDTSAATMTEVVKTGTPVSADNSTNLIVNSSDQTDFADKPQAQTLPAISPKNNDSVQNSIQSHEDTVLTTNIAADQNPTPARASLIKAPVQKIIREGAASVTNYDIHDSAFTTAESAHSQSTHQPTAPAPLHTHDSGILNAASQWFFAGFGTEHINKLLVGSTAHNIIPHTWLLALQIVFISLAFVICLIVLWHRKGFGQVISPRGRPEDMIKFSIFRRERPFRVLGSLFSAYLTCALTGVGSFISLPPPAGSQGPRLHQGRR